jgi:hypothetical protein
LTLDAPRASLVAKGLTEFVAEVVPRVATAARHATAAPDQRAASLEATVWGEEERDARADDDAESDTGDKNRGRAAILGTACRWTT